VLQALTYWPLTPRRPMCNGSHFAGRREFPAGARAVAGRSTIRITGFGNLPLEALGEVLPPASSRAATRLQPNGVALARSRRHETGLAGRKRSSGKDGMGPSATGWAAAQRTAKPRLPARIRSPLSSKAGQRDRQIVTVALGATACVAGPGLSVVERLRSVSCAPSERNEPASRRSCSSTRPPSRTSCVDVSISRLQSDGFGCADGRNRPRPYKVWTSQLTERSNGRARTA
jgi:hypothetical protein